MEALDITAWLKSFTPEDISLMVGIGIVAAFLHRSEVISARWAIILPVLIGLVLGIMQAVTITPGQWGSGLYFARGIIMGGGAGLVGRGVSMALDKLNIFPVQPPKPPAPPPPEA